MHGQQNNKTKQMSNTSSVNFRIQFAQNSYFEGITLPVQQMLRNVWPLICAFRKIQLFICPLWWMRVLEYMTLGTIFGPRWEEAKGRWSKLRHGSSMIVHLNKHS